MTNNIKTNLRLIILLAVSILIGCNSQSGVAQTTQLKYKPAPVDNPLKGLVPYWHQHGQFPCSMEFWYFPISELMTGPNSFDWSAVEDKLEDSRSRGNQMVIRTYLESVQKMGYELFVSEVQIENDKDASNITLKIENKGVAPFYYDWPIELATLNSSGEIVSTSKTDWRLTEAVPGESVRMWNGKIQLDGAKLEKLAIRVPNPMKGGKYLRFANETQQENGWLILWQ